MKILIGTKETQGKRKNDFSFTNDREILRFGFECDGERVDGRCGCKRSMVGVVTHKATTTIRVEDVELNEDQLSDILFQSMKDAGWITEKNESSEKLIKEQIEDIKNVANSFPAGAVIERRGRAFAMRTMIH